jgi:hypothetical protein
VESFEPLVTSDVRDLPANARGGQDEIFRGARDVLQAGRIPSALDRKDDQQYDGSQRNGDDILTLLHTRRPDFRKAVASDE